MTRMKAEVSKKDEKKSTLSTIKKPFNGFFDFLAEYSIIGMALGIIIGATTKDTVNALVEGIITPTIQLLMPNTQLQDLVVTIGKAEFQVGMFFEALLEMIIIMALLYIFVGVVMKRKDLISKKSKKKK